MSVPDNLREFERAMLNQEYETAEALALEIADKIDNDRDETSELVRSLAVRDSGPQYSDVDSESRQGTHEHIASGFEIQLSRMNILLTLTSMVVSPESYSDQEIQDDITSLADQFEESEESLNKTSGQARKIHNTVESPPKLTASIISDNLTGPYREVELGAEIEIETTLRNIGDQSVEAVSVSFHPSTDIEFEQDQIEIGDISPDAEKSISVSLMPAESGELSIRAQVESDNAGSAVAIKNIVVRESEEQRLQPNVSSEYIAGGGAAAAGLSYLAYRTLFNNQEDDT